MGSDQSTNVSGSGARGGDLEATLGWITTGYRVFAALWLTILGAVVLNSTTTDVARPGVVAATIGIVLVWAAAATSIRVTRPRLLAAWWFVAIDLAVSAWSVISGSAADTIQFAGGYPLAGAFGAVYAFGVTGGVAGAAVLTGSALWPLLTREQGFSQEVANGIAFLFSTAAAVGVVAVLRSADRVRAAAEAALTVERTERIRAEEHAEMASHLHDSVLQTLALIQRDPAATPDIRGLARHQERELRTWLYGDAATGNAGGFRESLLGVCAGLEDDTGAEIETVVVGDSTAGVDPIVRAAREAILNAVEHSGVRRISVYGEVADAVVQVFVKDRGAGFDPAAVDPSRLGIRESIVGRMERHGGSAEIISAPGRGTEVRLRLPIEGS
jgi:signal transduction histidine kinase